MIEIQALIATIYILYYSLIGVTIITFALIIALVVIISKIYYIAYTKGVLIAVFLFLSFLLMLYLTIIYFRSKIKIGNGETTKVVCLVIICKNTSKRCKCLQMCFFID